MDLNKVCRVTRMCRACHNNRGYVLYIKRGLIVVMLAWVCLEWSDQGRATPPKLLLIFRSRLNLNLGNAWGT